MFDIEIVLPSDEGSSRSVMRFCCIALVAILSE